MTVRVTHEIMPLQAADAEGFSIVGVPPEGDVYWAECDLCGKRSRGWVVGMVSAPAFEAQQDADSHLCELDGHFSTIEKAWAEFRERLSHSALPKPD